MTIPVAPDSSSEPGKQPPLTMFGPDFPFPYDDYVSSPAGLGSVPDLALGTEVAVIGGGLSGMIAAYELLKVGLKPIVYEADQIGGRMRSVEFDGHPGVVAEMGAMRFPPSSTTLFHYLNELGLQTEEFPNPLAEVTPSTVIDLKGESHYAHTLEDLPPIYTEVAQAWQRTLEEHADLIPLQQAIRDRDTAEIKRIWNDLVVRYDDRRSTDSSPRRSTSSPSTCGKCSDRSDSVRAVGIPTTQLDPRNPSCGHHGRRRRPPRHRRWIAAAADAVVEPRPGAHGALACRYYGRFAQRR